MPDGSRNLIENDRAARLSLPPARSYEVPGGPLAKHLGEVDVYKLSEIARGGADDFIRRGIR